MRRERPLCVTGDLGGHHRPLRHGLPALPQQRLAARCVARTQQTAGEHVEDAGLGVTVGVRVGGARWLRAGQAVPEEPVRPYGAEPATGDRQLVETLALQQRRRRPVLLTLRLTGRPPAGQHPEPPAETIARGLWRRIGHAAHQPAGPYLLHHAVRRAEPQRGRMSPLGAQRLPPRRPGDVSHRPGDITGKSRAVTTCHNTHSATVMSLSAAISRDLRGRMPSSVAPGGEPNPRFSWSHHRPGHRGPGA
jgi:hypothetical protein